MSLPWFGAAVLSLAAAVGAVGAPASYVGGERCKLCHRSVYQSWLATPHARTKTTAGVEERCYQCHATEA
ncbi:MAG TPA: multiheme c-type cytochrome, partial [Vicinamibacteria bacterium]